MVCDSCDYAWECGVWIAAFFLLVSAYVFWVFGCLGMALVVGFGLGFAVFL